MEGAEGVSTKGGVGMAVLDDGGGLLGLSAFCLLLGFWQGLDGRVEVPGWGQ